MTQRTVYSNFKARRDAELSRDTALACCGFIAVYLLLTALALTVAITDLVGGRTHLSLDIFLIVVFGLPYLASAFRRAA